MSGIWRLFSSHPDWATSPQARAADNRINHLTAEVEHLKVSLTKETQIYGQLSRELTALREVNLTLQAKFDFCAEQLQQERARNRELLDRLMALTDRRGYQTWKGEVQVPAPQPPPPPPPEPEQIPTPEELEARFRMR